MSEQDLSEYAEDYIAQDHDDPMTRPQPTPSAEVEALEGIIAKHMRSHLAPEFCTSGCLAHALAAYVQAARDEERARVIREVRDKATEVSRVSKTGDLWFDVAAYIEARGGAR